MGGGGILLGGVGVLLLLCLRLWCLWWGGCRSCGRRCIGGRRSRVTLKSCCLNISYRCHKNKISDRFKTLTPEISMGSTKTNNKEKYQATRTDKVTNTWCLYQLPYWKRRNDANRNVVTKSIPNCQLDMFLATLLLQEFN